jgi:hypothetical protein
MMPALTPSIVDFALEICRKRGIHPDEAPWVAIGIAAGLERAAKAVEDMPMPPGGFGFRAHCINTISALRSTSSSGE